MNTMAVGTLVTGGSGFLGRALVRRLRRDRRAVRLLVRRTPEWAAAVEELDIVIGDLADREAVDRAVAGVSVVYHAGATTRGSAHEFQTGTVLGTQHVIDACLRHDVGRLVYVSSLGVLAPPASAPEVAVTEDSPVDPHPERRGSYTHAKVVAEQLVRSAILQRGLPAVVVRPGQIVGPGAERVVPNATLALGRYWLAVGPADQPLPLVYLDDVVDALVLAATGASIEGRVFHVIDPHPITHDQYLDRYRRLPGTQAQIVRVPSHLLGLVAHAAEWAGRRSGRDVPLTRYRVHALRPHRAFDLTAAFHTLGWTPRIGIVDGLRATFG